MVDDTPDTAPSESPVPVISNRNEDDASGVALEMEPTATPKIDEIEPGSPKPKPISEQRSVRPVPVSDRIRNEPEKSASRTAFTLAASVVAGVVGALLTVGVLSATGTLGDTEVAPPTTTIMNAGQATQVVEVPPIQITNNRGAAVSPFAVAVKAIRSVVTITVFEAPADGESPPFGVGSGSGVVISRDGYIITNHHVIDDADLVRVTFEDGRVYQATLIGSDDLTDLAVLQIEATDLTAVEFGASDVLRVGDPAVAIGNPLGQEGGASVTLGIISAFDRRVEFANNTFLHGMIQTDAAINSGSSGGGLFDAEGNLIGITSAIGVSRAGPEGIGYAIPIELVDRITAEIIETGDVAHPFLGVSVVTHTEVSDDGAIVPAGAVIGVIESTDSAAGLAGLEPGDVITKIGDREITDQTDLILAVRLYRVGDEVEFVAIRGGVTVTFTVVMGQRPAEFGG